MAQNGVPDSCFENLPKLVEDLDDYLEAYQAYAEFSGLKVNIYKDWARIIFEDHVVSHFTSKFPSDETIRVLAVGSGDGSFAISYLFPPIKIILHCLVTHRSNPLQAVISLMLQYL